MSRRAERTKRAAITRREAFWELCPQTSGIYRFDANPRNYFVAGAQFHTGPSLVLAPKSALRLPPRRALSSAPAPRSVFAPAFWCNDGTKKELDYRSVFRQDPLPACGVY